jgi:dTDP-glucose pyrophosphorylase
MKVIIPMAGRGSRFEQAGFANPKPLIDVQGKPMIQRVIDNIDLPAEYIFLVLQEHLDRFNLAELLPSFTKHPVRIVPVAQVTEGAACTVLLAREFIDNDEELLLANSDQLVDWDPPAFVDDMRSKNADGGILTFYATESKWSFAKVDPRTGLVLEVAEKNPISTNATVGIYYYKTGRSFVAGAEQMIGKNIRTNNEFYVCPIYNELIEAGLKVYNYPVSEMWGVGTPEDLAKYLAR